MKIDSNAVSVIPTKAGIHSRLLTHITVVDLTVNLPGPFCSMTLADLGARVLKVEPPGGDPLRRSSPAMWTGLNRGKESIVLDLKDAGDRRTLARLAGDGDVVLEGWRPGVAARLGAGYSTLSRENDRLVYCSISGFGQDGPWRERPGHDINYLALAGYLGLQSAIEGRPWLPPVLVSDLASGLYAAIMVLAALNGREATGRGTYVDLSMTEAALALLGPELEALDSDGPVEPNVTGIPHYGLFRCADGLWFSLGIVHEDHFWDRLCRAAGLDDLAGLTFDQRMARRDMIEERLNVAFERLPSTEWERRLEEADVPGARVISPAEVFDTPQFAFRRLFSEIGPDRFVGQPALLSGERPGPRGRPPEPDEHGAAIRSEFGGVPVR